MNHNFIMIEKLFAQFIVYLIDELCNPLSCKVSQLAMISYGNYLALLVLCLLKKV